MSKRFTLCVWPLLCLAVVLLPACAYLDGGQGGAWLAEFEAKGLPDVSDAEYVKVDDGGRSMVSGLLGFEHDNRGNAWMLDERRGDDGKPMTGDFVINGGQRASFSWDGKTRWAKASWERDLRWALAYLKRAGGDELLVGFGVKPRLFLFALQLRQQGRYGDSDALLEALFKRSTDKAAVVREALNMLADCQAEELAQRFRADHDWKEYRDGLKTLLERWPSDWEAAPKQRNLLALLERRVATPDALGSQDLTPDERALALGLLETKTLRRSEFNLDLMDCPWMLPAVWTGKFPSDDPDLKVRALGVGAVPFLLKLVDDDTPTCVALADVAPGEPPLLALDNPRVGPLPAGGRSATLGEVARFLLRELLPPERTPSDKDVVQRAKEFWTEHGDDSQEQSALLFLSRRSGQVNADVVNYLLQLAKGGRLPHFEGALLAGAMGSGLRPQEAVDAFVPYIALRGRDAKEFGREFVVRFAALEPSLVLAPHRGYGNQRRAEGLAAQLRVTPFGASAEKLLSAFLANGSLPGYGVEALRVKLAVMEPDTVLGELLRQAVAAKTPEARLLAANLLGGLWRQGALDGLSSPTLHAELWRTLLDDQREVGGGGWRVSDYYLDLNERLSAPAKPRLPTLFGDVGPLYPVSGRQDAARLRERVLARLAGTGEKAK